MRAVSKPVWLLWIVMAAVMTAVAIATFVTAAVIGPTSTPTPRYPQAQLQADLQMTEQMGVPGASGPMFNGSVVDDQLRRSLADPGYAAALTARQREIDQMLARGTP